MDEPIVDVPKHTDADLQRMLEERDVVWEAKMQEKIDKYVAATLAGKLALEPPLNASNSFEGGPKAATSPGSSKREVPSYTALGHDYPLAPIQMPHMTPSGSSTRF